MKILLCLNKDIYSCIALNHLIDFLKNDEIKICFSSGVGVVKEVEELNELLFLEQKFLLNDFLLGLKKEGNYFKNFDEIIESNKIELLEFNNINIDGAVYLKNSWQCDLVISIRYGKIFKDDFISAPTIGILNLHSGILPKYRGIMSTFWAMLDGQNEIGTTLHEVTDNQIDKGETLAISRELVRKDKSLIFNICSLYEEGCNNIKLVVSNIRKSGNVSSILDSEEIDVDSSYHSYPSKLDFEKFKERFKLIDKNEFLSGDFKDFFKKRNPLI